MINPLIFVILFYVIIVTIRALVSSKFGFKISYFVTTLILSIYFLFGQANFENTDLYTFYGFMALFILVLNNPAYSILEENKILNFKAFKLTGLAIIGFSVISGIILTLTLFLLQSRTTGAIFGVPTLAVINSKAFTATTFGALGFIENGFFLSISGIFGKYILKAIPFPIFKVEIFTKLVSILIGGGLFAIFHSNAYNLAVGSIIWAMSVFTIWGVVYTFSSELAGSSSHYWWNALITLGKTLSIK